MSYRYFIKPSLDFCFAFLALIISSPIILISILLIKLTSKGPVFFTQDRMGKDGNIFKLYKLRTMTHVPRIPGREIMKFDEEVTGLGKILRRFKIDELPQTYNILRGEMSFVGPRPCLPEMKNDFDEFGIRRIEVKPGLTGLAQINGNINLSWADRWKYDKKYVDSFSFLLDLKIVVTTFFIIIFGEDSFIKPPNV